MISGVPTPGGPHQSLEQGSQVQHQRKAEYSAQLFSGSPIEKNGEALHMCFHLSIQTSIHWRHAGLRAPILMLVGVPVVTFPVNRW